MIGECLAKVTASDATVLALRDEARHIPTNITKLPELLGAEEPG